MRAFDAALAAAIARAIQLLVQECGSSAWPVFDMDGSVTVDVPNTNMAMKLSAGISTSGGIAKSPIAADGSVKWTGTGVDGSANVAWESKPWASVKATGQWDTTAKTGSGNVAVQQPVGTELFKVEIVNAKIAGTSFTQGNTSGEVRVSVNNKLVGSGSGSVGIEETTNTVKLDVTVKDDAWAVLAAVKANVTILGKAGVTTTNRLDVEVKTGSASKLLFSQQLAVFGDDGGEEARLCTEAVL